LIWVIFVEAFAGGEVVTVGVPEIETLQGAPAWFTAPIVAAPATRPTVLSFETVTRGMPAPEAPVPVTTAELPNWVIFVDAFAGGEVVKLPLPETDQGAPLWDTGTADWFEAIVTGTEAAIVVWPSESVLPLIWVTFVDAFAGGDVETVGVPEIDTDQGAPAWLTEPIVAAPATSPTVLSFDTVTRGIPAPLAPVPVATAEPPNWVTFVDAFAGGEVVTVGEPAIEIGTVAPEASTLRPTAEPVRPVSVPATDIAV
jgi:hypothetical protein